MKILSVFIDESGDFGKYEKHSPYYFISMVLHDQTNSIKEQLDHLHKNLNDSGFPSDFYIHIGPLIRNEDEFKAQSIEVRRKLFSDLFSFFRVSKTSYRSFYVNKKYINSTIGIVSSLSNQIAEFITENKDYFDSFDKIVIYYDNGQHEVTKIIASVFSIFFKKVEYKKPRATKHKLFQSADLVCSLELIKLKLKSDNLSSSERLFFKNNRILKNNYLKPLDKKQFKS